MNVNEAAVGRVGWKSCIDGDRHYDVDHRLFDFFVPRILLGNEQVSDKKRNSVRRSDVESSSSILTWYASIPLRVFLHYDSIPDPCNAPGATSRREQATFLDESLSKLGSSSQRFRRHAGQ